MTPDLERLIDLALADGVLTDKERQVLYRKAQELEVDMDEFEMVLDGKLHLAQKSPSTSQQSTTASRSQKEGDARKCPSCGAPALSFAVTCSTCGHEFRNANAANSVQKLFDTLQAAPSDSHATIISNFPVPNTREDILEFLSAALGNCAPLTQAQRQSFGVGGALGLGSPELRLREAEIMAWQSKFRTVLQKGRILCADTTTITMLGDFERRFEIAITSESKAQKKGIRNALIGLGLFSFAMFGLGSIGESSHVEDKAKESDRLETIVDQVQKDIEARNFSSALVKASSLKWTYSDSWSHYEHEKKAWDERRESMVQSIKEAQKATQ